VGPENKEIDFTKSYFSVQKYLEVFQIKQKCMKGNTTYLNIACCAMLLNWLLRLLPGTVTVLASGYSKLCPAPDVYFILQLGTWEEISQRVCLTVPEGTWNFLPCTHQDEAIPKIPCAMRKTVRVLSV